MQHNVIRFYAELKAYEPKVWRRFEINGEKTMAELAYTVMILFEMQASHLFSIKEFSRERILQNLYEQFSEEAIQRVLEKHKDSEMFQDIRYEIPDEDRYLGEHERWEDATSVTLNRVPSITTLGTHFQLTYDFGDDWQVDLVVEAFEKREVSLSVLPQALEGEGFGIVEDVGGVHGLQALAQTLQKGSGSEYESMTQWLDSATLDLEKFDVQDSNRRVKKLMSMYRNSYERGEYPMDHQLKWLLREYQGKGSRGY